MKTKTIALIQAATSSLEGIANFTFPYTLAVISAWIKHAMPKVEVYLAHSVADALAADEIWCTSLSEDWGNALALGKVFTEEGKKFVVGGHHATALPMTMPYGRVHTGALENVRHISELPLPDWTLFPNIHDKPGMIMTSRGCPFSCNFCSSSAFWKSYQTKSPFKVVEEIKLLANIGISEIIIFDDLFTLDIRRLKIITELICAEGLDYINYSCLVRSDTVNPEIITLLKKMGVKAVAFGSESGDDGILKLMNKQTTVSKNINAIKLLYSMGYTPNTSIVIGYPGESKDTLKRTCDYIETIRPLTSIVDIYPVIPYPGTKLWNIFMDIYNPDIMNFDWETLSLRSNTVAWDKYFILSDKCSKNDLKNVADWNMRYYRNHPV